MKNSETKRKVKQYKNRKLKCKCAHGDITMPNLDKLLALILSPVPVLIYTIFLILYYGLLTRVINIFA